MAMTGYTKLFNSILASTIWREDDKTRLVWITLLAMADKNGLVEASIPGLADLAHVSIEDCECALGNLQKPDKYSRSQEHDGRRIQVCDGGWVVLNHTKYRDKMSQDDKREQDRERQRRHRQQNKGVTLAVTHECDMSRMSRHTDTDTENKNLSPEPKSSSGSVSPRRKKTIKTVLPDSFGISDAVREWAQGKNYSSLEERLEHFVGYARAKGVMYADWDQAFQNAIRQDWAKLNGSSNGNGNGAKPMSASEITRLQREGREWRQ